MAKYVGDFDKCHTLLVVIGNGEAQHLKPFREVTGYNGLLYTDPSLAVFKTLGFKRGMGSLIGFNTFKEGFRAFKDGHGQEGIQGSVLQQGGALVTGPGNTVHYFYRNREPGDHAPIKDLLDACEK